jgi:hypothetical protein
MLPAIYLDDQRRFGATEIDDIASVRDQLL